MCKNGKSLQGVRFIDHIPQKHREELHLPEIVSATDLFAKLENVEIEILPKLSRIFNTLGQWLICFYLTPSVSIFCQLCINLLLNSFQCPSVTIYPLYHPTLFCYASLSVSIRVYLGFTMTVD